MGGLPSEAGEVNDQGDGFLVYCEAVYVMMGT